MTTRATPHVLCEASALEVIPCTLLYSVGHQKVAWDQASVGKNANKRGAKYGLTKGAKEGISWLLSSHAPSYKLFSLLWSLVSD